MRREIGKGFHWETGALIGVSCSLILAVWRSKNPIILNHIKLTEHGLVFSFMFICVNINGSEEILTRSSRSDRQVRQCLKFPFSKSVHIEIDILPFLNMQSGRIKIALISYLLPRLCLKV